MNIQTRTPAAQTLENTLTLFDPGRSIGTDITQMKKARAIVLASDATTTDQFSQGAGRMRELRFGQTLEVWTSQKLKGEPKEKLDSFMNNLYQNQVSLSKDKNKQALNQMMEAEIKGAMLANVLGIPLQGTVQEKSTLAHKEPNIKEALQHYSKYRNYIINRQDYDPKATYENVGIPVHAKINLENARQEYIHLADKYFSGSSAWNIKKNLELYPKLWVKVPLSDSDYGITTGASQEVKADVAVANQTKTQTQTQTNTQTSTQMHSFQIGGFRSISDPEYHWPNEAGLFNNPLVNPNAEKTRVLYKELNSLRRTYNLYDSSDNDNILKRIEASVIKTFTNFKIKRIEHEIDQLGMKTNPNGNVVFLNVRNVLDSHISLSEPKQALSFFTPNFLLSTNFSDQIRENSSEILQYAEGDSVLTQLQYLMLVEENGQYTAVAINGNDELAVRQLLEENRANGNSNTRKIAIYDLNSDLIVDQGTNKLDKNALSLPSVQELIVQGKVLAGQRLEKNSPLKAAFIRRFNTLKFDSVEEKRKAFMYMHTLFVSADQDHKKDYMWLKLLTDETQ